jgi:hypothetical protein
MKHAYVKTVGSFIMRYISSLLELKMQLQIRVSECVLHRCLVLCQKPLGGPGAGPKCEQSI